MRRLNPSYFFIVSLLLLDSCGLILAFEAAYFTRFSWPVFLHYFPITKGVPARALYQQTLIALLPMWILVFSYGRLYRTTLISAYDEFIQILKGVCLCAILTTAMSFALRGIEYSRLTILLWTGFSVALVYALREIDKSLFRYLMFRLSGPKHVLVIGKGKALEAIRQMAHRQPFVKAYFMEAVPEPASMAPYIRENRISQVLLIQGTVPAAAILETAQFCEQANLECHVVPDLLEIRRGEIILNGFCGLPTFHIKPASLHGTNYLMKRSFDIIVSLAILTIIVVPMLFVAILVKLETRGPALFTQDRMGLLGRKFKLFKFRTMVANADDYIEKLKHLSDRKGPVFKMKDDPRVTVVGNWLRRFSIDEMPQILNVLTGDMSLVGPRPQVLWEAAHYDDTAKKRLRVMPGITGLWQVSGRAALSYEQMINLDIYYLENWSLGLDLKILLRTLPAIFEREGAY